MYLLGLFGCKRWKPILANLIEWKLLEAYVSSSQGEGEAERALGGAEIMEAGTGGHAGASMQGATTRWRTSPSSALVFKWPEASSEWLTSRPGGTRVS